MPEHAQTDAPRRTGSTRLSGLGQKASMTGISTTLRRSSLPLFPVPAHKEGPSNGGILGGAQAPNDVVPGGRLHTTSLASILGPRSELTSPRQGWGSRTPQTPRGTLLVDRQRSLLSPRVSACQPSMKAGKGPDAMTYGRPSGGVSTPRRTVNAPALPQAASLGRRTTPSPQTRVTNRSGQAGGQQGVPPSDSPHTTQPTPSARHTCERPPLTSRTPRMIVPQLPAPQNRSQTAARLPSPSQATARRTTGDPALSSAASRGLGAVSGASPRPRVEPCRGSTAKDVAPVRPSTLRTPRGAGTTTEGVTPALPLTLRTPTASGSTMKEVNPPLSSTLRTPRGSTRGSTALPATLRTPRGSGESSTSVSVGSSTSVGETPRLVTQPSCAWRPNKGVPPAADEGLTMRGAARQSAPSLTPRSMAGKSGGNPAVWPQSPRESIQGLTLRSPRLLGTADVRTPRTHGSLLHQGSLQPLGLPKKASLGAPRDSTLPPHRALPQSSARTSLPASLPPVPRRTPRASTLPPPAGPYHPLPATSRPSPRTSLPAVPQASACTSPRASLAAAPQPPHPPCFTAPNLRLGRAQPAPAERPAGSRTPARAPAAATAGAARAAGTVPRLSLGSVKAGSAGLVGRPSASVRTPGAGGGASCTTASALTELRTQRGSGAGSGGGGGTPRSDRETSAGYAYLLPGQRGVTSLYHAIHSYCRLSYQSTLW
jgi:hypothetical protein